LFYLYIYLIIYPYCCFNYQYYIIRSEKENTISYKIRGAAYQVYKQLGAGLLESVYEVALKHELEKEGIQVKNQVPLAVSNDGIILPDF
jgi:hypothetical protein